MTKLPDDLLHDLEHCDGYDCTCYAYYDGECGCYADWRSQDEVVMDYVRAYGDVSVVADYMEVAAK